ncbi:hypothetical protein D3C76_1872030 [compost metagenome]
MHPSTYDETDQNHKYKMRHTDKQIDHPGDHGIYGFAKGSCTNSHHGCDKYTKHRGAHSYCQ